MELTVAVDLVADQMVVDPVVAVEAEVDLAAVAEAAAVEAAVAADPRHAARRRTT